MAEIKSHEFDRFCRSGIESYRIFLVYGPDRGLVSERANVIATKSGVSTDDPFAMVKLDSSDLAGDPGRIADEVGAFGLFGGKKLIWVRASGTEKPLVDALQSLSNGPPSDNVLLIEAGDVKKGSGVRKVAEAARSIAAVPCYADDARAMNNLIDDELKAEDLNITPMARERLLEALGGDRLASRGEIRKLALYRSGQGTIDDQHVMDIIGDASAVSVDDATDAVLEGDLERFGLTFAKVVASKTPVFLILQSCLKQFQLLDLMRSEMEEKRAQPTQIMQTLGRHIHFRRKPIIEKALRNWDCQSIARESSRLQTAILQTRQRQSLEDSIAFHLLMSIGLQSARQNNIRR